MLTTDDTMLILESPGIGIRNESSLHSSIKKWYSLPGDRIEVKMEGYFIDIVRDDLLIEIQTKNFGAMKEKLCKLLKKYKIRLVHPIPEEKYIIKVNPLNNEIVSKRKSPKRGELVDLFNELIRIPAIINEDNFSLEVLIIKEEDILYQDGKGSWRRKGASIIDKKLTDVISSTVFEYKSDFNIFLPPDMTQPFTNKTLAENAGYSLIRSRKVTYGLKKMGLIREVGKIRNELLFEVVK